MSIRLVLILYTSSFRGCFRELITKFYGTDFPNLVQVDRRSN